MANLNKELNEYLLKSKNNQQCEISVESEDDSSQKHTRMYSTMHKNNTDRKWYRELKEECFSSMTKKQRIVACALCSISGLFCLLLSTLYLPVLLMHQTKFVALYTLGSILLLLSLCFLWGPTNYVESLLSPKRRYYALSYIGMLIGTLYCTIFLKSKLLASLCCILETVAMISFIVSSLPGGTIGLSLFSKLCSRMFSRMFKSSVNSTLSI